MQFSDVLACTIHDIKNSLGMIINTLEEFASDPDSGLADNPKAAVLQLEARRVNNDFIQLLTLYKLGGEQLIPNIAEHSLEDFIDDIVVENQSLANSHGIHIDFDYDPMLSGYFDEDLVRGVINNAIDNAQRYTRDRLLLKAEAIDGYSVIRVEDNGRGFPASMLELQKNLEPEEGFKGGHTHLGLYFSNQIAKLHKNKGREGFILLENGKNLEGGSFSVWLP